MLMKIVTEASFVIYIVEVINQPLGEATTIYLIISIFDSENSSLRGIYRKETTTMDKERVS